MRDRFEKVLRIVCLVLVALALVQLVRAGFRAGQLAGVKIPAVPTLETNAVTAAGPASVPKMPAANSPAAARTNVSLSTNSAPAPAMLATNPAATAASSPVLTHAPAREPTNILAVSVATNDPVALTNTDPPVATNNPDAGTSNAPVAATHTALPAATNTNQAAATNTNPAVATNNLVAGTSNAPVAATHTALPAATNTNQVAATTNRPAAATNNNPVAQSNPAASPGPNKHRLPAAGRMAGMPGAAPELPAETQAQVDQIVSSEIFAPVNHPLPMGLLGIAGDTAFLRTAAGETGLVKVGDSLGDLKLLQIGINRVLVEQGGDKKELTIFDGYGGDSLLTNQDGISK